MVDFAARDAVWIDVLPSMRNFGSTLAKEAGKEADKSGKEVGGKFGKAMLAGVAAVAGGAVLAGKALYGIGETFDEVSDTIRVGTGATGKALDDLVASAKTVGKNVPAEFEQIGQVVADVNTRLGLTGPTLEKFSSQVLEASRIMGEEIDINAMSAAFNVFQIQGEDTTEAMDHLFRVSQATGVGMNDLAKNATTAAPAMQALGFSFEETTALVGNLDKAGLNSSKMMAGMSKALVELAKDGEEPQEAFKRITGEIEGYLEKGDKAAAVDLAAQLFGTRNATQFIGALESGALAMDDLGKVAGMTEDTILGAGAETMDFAEQWQMFKNEIMVAIAPAAEWLFGKIGEGMTWLRETGIPALKDFGKWLGENKTIMIALGVAVGTAVVGFGAMKILTAVKTWLMATTLATKGLNAALKANPIGIVITAIAALVGALVWLYQNNETAKKIIDAAWNAIKSAVQVVVNWFVDTAWPWIQKALQWIGDKATWLWKNAIKPAWDFIWNLIKNVAGWVKDTAWPWFRSALQQIGDKASWLWNKAIVPAWEGIKSAVKGAWDFVKGIWDKFKSGLQNLGDRFGDFKDGVARTFGAIVTAIAKPIRAVIQFVNDKLIGGLNNLLSKIPGVDLQIPLIPVPELPHFQVGPRRSSGGRTALALAEGGTVPGWSPHPRADNIPAMLTAGEYVLPVNAVRALRDRFGDSFLEMLRRGLPGFARGGEVGGNRKPHQGGLGDVFSAIKSGAEWVGGLITDPIGTIKRTVQGLLEGVGNSWPAKVLIGLGSKIIDGLVNWVKGIFGGGGDDSGIPAGGWSVDRLTSFVTGLDPTARITSGKRGRRLTASGFVSYHSLGRAVDFVSANIYRTMQLLAATGMPWTEAYYTPWGFMRRGRMVPSNQVSPVTKATHYDHGHLAMALGGLVPKLFDRGGILDPGANLVFNNTGGPETLVRPEQLALSKQDMAEAVRAGVDGAVLVGPDQQGLWRLVRREEIRVGNRARMGVPR